MVNLGQLQVAALVDTGSDYDAIDRDLAELQVEEGNPAFVSRQSVKSRSVRGFAEGLNKTTAVESAWALTLTGAVVYAGEPEERSVSIRFTEFQGLRGPHHFGNASS